MKLKRLKACRQWVRTRAQSPRPRAPVQASRLSLTTDFADARGYPADRESAFVPVLTKHRTLLRAEGIRGIRETLGSGPSAFFTTNFTNGHEWARMDGWPRGSHKGSVPLGRCPKAGIGPGRWPSRCTHSIPHQAPRLHLAVRFQRNVVPHSLSVGVPASAGREAWREKNVPQHAALPPEGGIA